MTTGETKPSSGLPKLIGPPSTGVPLEWASGTAKLEIARPVEDVDDEYTDQPEPFIQEHPGSQRELVEEAFDSQCATFREVMTDDTPPSVIRRLAYEQVTWDPPSVPRAAEVEMDVAVEGDGGTTEESSD